MPTDQELSDLCDKCDWKWTTKCGVSGYVVRGRGGYASASIFLPAAGEGIESDVLESNVIGSDDKGGYYWASVPGYYNAGWCIDFDKTGFYPDTDSRYHGYPVRPVQGFAE